MELKVTSLNVIQDELRDIEQLPEMVKFVEAGGIFDKYEVARHEGCETKNGLLMEIAKFPGDEMYVHNGHHRAVAIYLGRPNRTIHKDEYYTKEWEFKDYMDINFHVGYLTPFDIRKETRIADIGPFKNDIDGMFEQISLVDIMRFIIQHPEQYKRDKVRFTVKELAQYYDEHIQAASKEEGAHA